MTRFGAIEAGGTKFVCAVGTGPGDIVDRVRIPTTTPDETLGAVSDYFRGRAVEAVGIATFGPVEIRPSHPHFGRIGRTPKPGWEGADLVAAVTRVLDVPVAVDTDVNGAALAEALWGAGQDKSTVLYITVGTGLGGGAAIDGRTLRGLVHPEMGHVSVGRLADDRFPGVCPFHGDCLEGMASGTALQARWGRSAAELGPDHDAAVVIEAHYLAAGFRQFVYTLAPEVIVMGGGVAHLGGLHEAVNRTLVEMMNGYSVQPEHARGFVVPPGLGDDAGVAGALALAAGTA
ncbi:MAG TPA: ROK family protein [Acidimicrobiia bacterium]|nr:ROK family protein [Acidimicrobiia bacterium]